MNTKHQRLHQLFRLLPVVFCLIVLSWSESLYSQNAPMVVAEKLNFPTGIAVHPSDGSVFVADSGNQRIVRIDKGEIREVIVGFPLGDSLTPTTPPLSALAVSFLDENTLIVGTAGKEGKRGQLRAYTIDDKVGPPINEKDYLRSLVLRADDGEYATKFWGVVTTSLGVFALGQSGDGTGWLGHAPIDQDAISNFSSAVRQSRFRDLGHSAGMTLSPEGYLVLLFTGAFGQSGDSTILYLDLDGQKLGQFAIGHGDVVGAAVAPHSRMLYFCDNSGTTIEPSGVYRLVADSSTQGFHTELVAELKGPTAMAFDHEGRLFVSCTGAVAADGSTDMGFVVRIDGLDKTEDH
ncbi:MAG: hypothetical protein R3C03_10075 [Pirellulaceae bacterium]